MIEVLSRRDEEIPILFLGTDLFVPRNQERDIMGVHTVDCRDLPNVPCEETVYRLHPKEPDERYYRERTDRNIGWLTRSEQDMLGSRCIGIAGCGGMGGLLASIFLRLGVGEVRIADCEQFDISNINRQFAATRSSVGKSKAFETARMIRSITDDGTLVVYPQGIAPDTSYSFLNGCDIVCDEIEFWAVGARILLHQSAEPLGIPLVNCSSVGFGTRFFLFDHTGMRMDEMLNLTIDEAYDLQNKIQSKTASVADVRRTMGAVLCALIPELPEYGDPAQTHRSVEAGLKRLREECRAPIIATNPPMASGFAANRTLLALLSGRAIVQPPKTPGYLYFDAGLMQARAVERREVHHVAL